MRLFDRVASGEVVHDIQARQWGVEDGVDNLRIIADKGVRLVADEAAHYIAAIDASRWLVNDGSFGLTRPPFGIMWVEWQNPAIRNINGKLMDRGKSRYAAIVADYGSGYDLTLLLGSREGIAVAPVQLHVDLTDGEFGAISVNYDDEDMDIIRREFDWTNDDIAGMYAAEAAPAFMALGWANSVNMKMEDRGPLPSLARKRRRHGQFPGHFYKVLTLDDQGRKAVAGELAERRGTRLHMVRGHFARYSPERPLFGRTVGQVWRHQHIRGEARLGALTNEYHVAARGQG